MNNAEYYKKELAEIREKGQEFCVVNGIPQACESVSCDKCDFIGTASTCCAARIKWLVSEYENTDIDWAKISVDTCIVVSDDGEKWHNRYFSRFFDGKVYAWYDGATSWSSDLKEDWPWKHAKLA